MRIGIVGIAGGWSSERLAAAAEKQTGSRLLIHMEDVRWDSQQNTLCYGHLDLAAFDALIVKKIGVKYSPHLLDRLYLLDFLHKRGTRVFSKPSSMLLALDRLSCTLKLRAHNIPMPPTVVTESVEHGCEAVLSFGTAVFKPLYSSKGRGMVVLSALDPQLKEKVTAFKNAGNTLMYIQKKVDIPAQDLGVMFLGGKYLATYARLRAADAWNTTTVNGGRYAPFEPAPEVVEIAARAQALFDLDYTGVDIVETEAGPQVFEVSAFGGFRGLYEAYGLDVAEKLLSYVLEQINA